MNDTRKPAGHDVQRDDTERDQQRSHGTQQHRSKKEGHATQIGSGQDQQNSRSTHRAGVGRKP